MQFSKKIVAIASAAALAVGGVTTAAVAAIPDSDDGEFHACVANTGPVRAMYAIDAEGSESCAAGYTEKTWETAPATKSHVKVMKKTKLSGGSGGNFGDVYTCGTGWTATGVTWKVTPSVPQGLTDVIVYPTDIRVDADVASAFFNSRSMNGTSGQVSLEIRITCMSEVIYDGVTTS